MVKNVLLVAMVSLCMTVTTYTSVLAGNNTSHPKNPPTSSPIQELSLENTLIYYGGLLKETHKSLFEGLGAGTEHIDFEMLYTYDFASTRVTFLGNPEKDSKPIGVICNHPGLKKFTVADVTSLLGQPYEQKIGDDGMLELDYDRVVDSKYLGCHVAFKFLNGKLQKISFADIQVKS